MSKRPTFGKRHVGSIIREFSLERVNHTYRIMRGMSSLLSRVCQSVSDCMATTGNELAAIDKDPLAVAHSLARLHTVPCWVMLHVVMLTRRVCGERVSIDGILLLSAIDDGGHLLVSSVGNCSAVGDMHHM